MIRRLVALCAAALLWLPIAGCDGETLNRWRAERGLAPLSEPELSRQVDALNRFEVELRRRASFVGEIERVDATRLGLSWHRGCPVGPDGLRLLRLSYWGFDGVGHEGELIVNARIATGVVGAFNAMWNEKFPIQRMETSEKFLTPDMFDAAGNFIEQPNTADTVNATQGFMCRRTTRAGSWSQHAFGLAIDVNPVQNPYVDGPLVIPLNGTRGEATGRIVASDVAVRAMRDAGMSWGGNFRSLKDYMHFSATGH